MIISASYKTDIPAFYGEWLLARLDVGFCRMVNPYGRQVYDIRLDPETVSGFVFWTKNVGPFLAHLAEIRRRGYAFTVQYSINNYPRELETSVTDAARARGHMRAIAEQFGPRAAVWRYDPIVATTLTPLDWHERNFAALAGRLAGTTDEVVISFAHIYRKTRRNMDAAAKALGFTWWDPGDGDKRSLAMRLAEIAAANGIRLTICSQPAYEAAGIPAARCIDAERLGDVAGRPIAARLKGNRPGCGCFESRDIGEYDTCPHGCVYCYAVHTPSLARRRYRAHDPTRAFLFSP